MGNFIENHPFIIVGVTSFIFMVWMTIEDMRAIKHRKYRREIEEKKRKKSLKS
jgi:hypothetical protein